MTRCTVPQTTTAAIRIHRIRYRNCAAPGYLARAGTPRSAEDLAMHAYVVSRSASNGRLLPGRLMNLAGEDALAGAGLVYIHSYMVQASLDAGTLTTVFDTHPRNADPIFAIFPHAKSLSPKVRVVVDHLLLYLPNKATAGQTDKLPLLRAAFRWT
jgi:LysR family transcriptional regulator for bpeEF and oprC